MALWQHQEEEVRLHTYDPARALFWEPRCGKTRTIITQLGLVSGSVKRVLIVAPIMALRMTWLAELLALEGTVLDLTQGTMTSRALKLTQYKKTEGCFYVLVNFEALKGLEQELAKFKFDGIVVDEAHLIKSPSAQRTRILTQLGKKAAWKRILTGTPTPNSYIDLYAQYKSLDSSVFGTNRNSFVGAYCFTHPKWISKITGYKNLEDLENKMNTRCTRITRESSFDMPQELPPIERVVHLPQAARKLYDTLAKNGIAQYAGIDINGLHPMAKLVKLQKLASGYIYENEKADCRMAA